MVAYPTHTRSVAGSNPAPATIARFLSERQVRLAAGAREYGDASFRLPIEALLSEIEQEALDVSGWAWVAEHADSRVTVRIAMLPLHVAAYALWAYVTTCRRVVSRPC